ncbi:Negative regulator of sporulation MDS3 [Wickerhamomyces ciferrii]|uniref:Negative regulator of sporulation MDS3 n=1 Tax=Wickerhamomyces ciferrii (strain ATCC 14091 / BCRC 22168 / CBS 111 / JCM 3599 / NBRC 0793 / NRRL Y-1031 F-60-10) TaxID=1206466 RepID=K0KUC2_WICCF|nr:Negative regulator of sporulation MDS3 [Wickerhamomyces ciferrii]CCH46756.1 Negative regulator of sporulation MDS3 [Wickerhamomyces ciferrii]
MAPLLPSESTAYSVTLPERSEDDRLNLNVRTGAASTFTKSTVVVHGGLTTGLQLSSITIPEIELKLEELEENDWNKLLSNEIFYLNIITRKWVRLDTDDTKQRPKPRLFHSIAFHKNSLFLFGGLVYDEGENQLVPTNDLWEFNTDLKQWNCIDNGSRSGAVNRYDLTLLNTEYISPEDHQPHDALIIAGGRSDLNQELNHITVYDLEQKKYVNNSEMDLNLNELKPERRISDNTEVDPRILKDSDKTKITATTEHNFIISGTTNIENNNSTAADDSLFIYSSNYPHSFSNPLVSLPISPSGSGIRSDLHHTIKHNSNAVPCDLRYPSGGIFGSNILVSGNSIEKNEYQVFSYNRPSKKWTKLSIDSKKKATEIYLWKCFAWPSHHKVLLLGSGIIPKDLVHPTVQYFDLMVTVGLPITNIYHASAVPQIENRRSTGPKSTSTMKENTSFEAYSKYAAPSTKISSIRSVFPNYAVALGRNAFERYGASLADFEFISADGEKINVPIMLLRKRWGRCFDMLLAKAYARAVYKLENQQQENSEGNSSDTNSMNSGSVGATANKKSMMVFNKGTGNTRDDRDVPKFRTPFQDARSTPPASAQQSLAPNSRKASVVSATSNLSTRTDSTDNNSFTPNLNFSNLPPQPPIPNEPLPAFEKTPRSSNAPTPLTPLNRNPSGSPFTNSPRGSVSGPTGAGSAPPPLAASTSRTKLKDEVKTPLQNFKKRDNSRSSSVYTTGRGDDTSSIADTFESLNIDSGDDSKLLLEPLLIPRSLYLPFATSTVQAVAEFLFTGQLGDKWLFQPTTLDSMLIAKFYEIPLLYDLISEVLYATIGKKEESLIKEYGAFVTDYQNKLKSIFRENDFKMNTFFEEHPHVRKIFVEIESYLNTVDDGYLNVTLLRKASKASTVSVDRESDIFKNPETGKRRSSIRSRAGKSSLSKEVNVDNEDDDIENEDENEDDEEAQQQHSLLGKVNSRISEKIKFNEDSMSSKSAKKVSSNSDDYDDVDPITPLNKNKDQSSSSNEQFNPKVSQESKRSEIYTDANSSPLKEAKDNDSSHKVTDDESIDPLTKMESRATHESHLSSGNKTESDNEAAIQVPEGRFRIKKNDLNRVKTNGSTSSDNDHKQSSDSEDVGVGLGLLDGAQLNETAQTPKPANGEFIDALPESSLPTLEFIASPDSPAPTDQLIQVIYEVSALACDIKLLLRAANALEMSKAFYGRKTELLSELNEFSLKHEEARLQEELAQRELEKKERKLREEESAAKQREIDAAVAKIEVEKKRLQQAKAEEAKAREKEAEIERQQQRIKRAESTSNLQGRSSRQQSVENDEESVTSGRSKGGLRSAFHSFRSFSSISLTNLNNKRPSPSPSAGTSDANNSQFSQPPRSQSSNTTSQSKPGSTSSDSSSKYKSIFSAILPKRSHTSKQ